MNIYLAARYSRRFELCSYRVKLEALGHKVTSRWLHGSHQISDADMSEQSRRDAKAHFATEDYEDVLAADIVISFTEEPRSSNTRGGRHVEFGIGLALGKRSIVVGWHENVFHLLPQVEFFPDFDGVLESFAKKRYDCPHCDDGKNYRDADTLDLIEGRDNGHGMVESTCTTCGGNGWTEYDWSQDQGGE